MSNSSFFKLCAAGVAAFLLALSASVVAAAPAGLVRQVDTEVQAGFVLSGSEPVPNATVSILRAGSTISNAQVLGTSTAGADGAFSVSYESPADPDAVLYAIALGPDGVRLASVLGASNVPASVIVNERTTVATSFAMAQFIEGAAIGGPDPGMPNAAGTFRNLVDVADGGIGDVLETPPNGDATTTLRTVNSLANMLASCVRSANDCSALFALAPAVDGSLPTNTLDAMSNIAQTPGSNVADLVALAQTEPLYTPALTAGAATDTAADDYVNTLALMLLYDGSGGPDGAVMDGPGNIAFDSEGNAWVNNNYAYDGNPDAVTCGSTLAVKFTPTGQLAPGSPVGGDDQTQNGVGGGGLYGAGYGMAVAPDDSAWITNFGFQGQQPVGGGATGECDQTPEELAVSVSRFDADGVPLSADGDPSVSEPGGYIIDQMRPDPENPEGRGQPQGIESDLAGTIWFAGCVDGSVGRFASDFPTTPYDFMFVTEVDAELVPEFDNAFDVAIDAEGDAWFTANATSNVVEIDTNFTPVRNLDAAGDFDKPMGIAVDSQGNMWVSNAGLPNPPCPAILGGPPNPLVEPVDGYGPIGPGGIDNVRASVTLIDGTSGSGAPAVTRFTKSGGQRDGLRWPWGMAIDGADNVWVANFAGQRIMRLCGVEEGNCRGGVTGDPVGPDEGYFNSGLARITAVQIDPSGNVWATNNWLLEGFSNPQNPGGRQVAVFVGLAAPVVTPRLGPVRTLPNDADLSELTLTTEWSDAIDGDEVSLSLVGDVNAPSTGTSTAAGVSNTVVTTMLDGETITIAEEFVADNAGTYDAALTCTDESGLTYTAGALDGVYTVPVASGDVNCTFVNTLRRVELVMDKEWVDGTEGDTATLSIAGADGDASGASTASGATGTELDIGVVTSSAIAGETVTLTEMLPDTNVGVYAPSLACDVGELIHAAGELTGRLTIPADIASGTTVTCTYTNAPPATITIVKDAIPDDGTDFEFITNLTPDGQPIILDDDGGSDTGASAVANSWTSPPVPADRSYSVIETPVAGWRLTSATCDNGDVPSNIVPAPGTNVTCTFVNQAPTSEIVVTARAENAASDAAWTFEVKIDPVGSGVTSPQTASGTGNESASVTFAPLRLGETYTLTGRAAPAGWSVSPLVCTTVDADPTEVGYQADTGAADATIRCDVVLTAPSSTTTTTVAKTPTGGSTSPLPNSGGDVARLVLVAGLLVGAGIGLRAFVRMSRHRRRF
ncbi:prealbumin-like fold domain-containing protein [Ilumatobacter sp.]|uniref:prealbumin-like fold domain-containing protein n=1 Tax=Ilumatobacter sp. TaxID=1967498 RepID=UPI003C480F25